ncbi:hypothetical protein Pedsa_2303 [Pseudopedobacter saltans DSM 12145]|uniref:Secretion system C-terminal sorting domain-containing protein n=1 Tax=Pseudopedobacter saltans (strain ATCC 51119 / DSM 12145 / JCM 21818 / CCUG 39354 / LMG 10337 / NBRC 100064 / NCIMB 13643) TaxID=762903 RepID=F0SD66_PSESL|nr:T9SS type A sorting domain-containing protein [Pseudopedobacter saltans]ADY52852.1 hypothetical protein Pedsa_2303 [Pseudopedobacter saltans DSM 12145]
MVKNILFRYIVSVCAIMALSKVVKASSATDYFRTKQSGNWNDINTWESSVDNIVWSNATLIPNTDATKIQIRYGHTAIVTANITLDDVEIEVGGTVDVLSGITLIIANGAATTDFGVSGILKSEGTVTPMGSLVFYSQGVYQHNYKASPGTIPLATWEDGSDCQIIGFTSSNGGIQGANQNFFNLTWNCPNQLVNTGPSLLIVNATVRNNFTILSTGLGGANLSVTNSDFKIKNLLQYDGYFAMINTNNASLTTTLRVTGDVNLQGGYFAKGSGSSKGVIIFSGTSEQKIDINSGHFYGALRFQVSENSIVNLATSTISNLVTGTFTVQDGVTLITAHPEGIALTGTTGAIQSTGVRTFSPNANYVFNASIAQQTGTGLPASVNNLTIDNSSGVTLRSGNLTVNGGLNISNGYLDLGANALITTGAIGLSGGGTLRTQNTSVNPLSTGKTWNGTVEYNGSSTQTIVSGQYNNLKLSESAKTLTGNLSISNDFDVSGASSVNTSTYKISYNGSGNQNVAGISYYDLDVAGAGTKTITAPATVSNNVTVNNAVLNANGNLTLLASPSSNANIGPLQGTADVVGEVKIQSFLSGIDYGAVRGSRTMSSPINDALISGDKTFAQLKKYMIITGNGGVVNGFDEVPSGLKNADMVLTYDNSLTSNSFVPLPNINSPSGGGRGFLYLFIGNRDFKDSTPGKLRQPFVDAESVSLTYAGPINKGNIDVPIGYNSAKTTLQGAFIGGNPYPATIDWHKVYASSSNLTPSISVVFGGRPMATYNAALGVGVNGGSRYIQPGQGFYVYANVGGGTLSFRESHKNINEVPARLLNVKERNVLESRSGKVLLVPVANFTLEKPTLLKLRLSSGPFSEETIVAFDSGFSSLADGQDSPYMAGSGYNINLSTQSSDNKPLAINLMSSNDLELPLKLNVNNKVSSVMTLNFDEIPEIADKLLVLKDAFTNTEQIISESNRRYDFVVNTSNANTFGSNRLSLSYNPSGVLPVEFTSFDVKKLDNVVELKWSVVKEEKDYIYIIEKGYDGGVFKEIAKINAVGIGSYLYVDQQPNMGNNYYRIKQVNADGVGKVTSIKTVKIDLTVSNKVFVLYPNPVKGEVKFKTSNAFYGKLTANILGANGSLIRSVQFSGEHIEEVNLPVEDLKIGVYMIELLGSSGQRIGMEKIVKN